MNLRNLFKNPKKKFNCENKLINLYDKEIKSVIIDYKFKQENNLAIKEDKIMDIFFENFARNMPQELLVFLNYYKLNNYKDIIEKINYFYSKTIHINIQTYIEKSKNIISVIYTFTPTVSSNKINNFSINNELVGNINKKNIKVIYVNLN